MKEEIARIKEQALEEVRNATNLRELTDLKVKYLGKKGELTSVLRGMGNLSPEERPVVGELVNYAKNEIEILINEKEEK